MHLNGKLLSLEESKTITSTEELVKEVSKGESPPQEVTSQEFALVQVNQAGAPLEILRTWSASIDILHGGESHD